MKEHLDIGHIKQLYLFNRLMAKDKDTIEYDGEIVDVLPVNIYSVRLVDPTTGENLDILVSGYMAGKMKLNRISVMLGDIVKIELNPYEINKGRIVYRYRENPHLSKPKINSVLSTA